MKNTAELARKAGIKNDCDGIWCDADQLEAFRRLIIEDLASGAGEPVLWQFHDSCMVSPYSKDNVPDWKPLYTSTSIAAAVAQASKRGAPCERHCEANAFRIELRQKDKRIADLESQLAAARKPLTCQKCSGRGWYTCGASDQRRKCYECDAAHGIGEQK